MADRHDIGMKHTIVLHVVASVAVAALLVNPAPALAGGTYRCGSEVYRTDPGQCRDGSIPVFEAELVTPAPAARPVHRFTRRERALMNARLNREAARIARQWRAGHPGQPMTAAQMHAIRNETCLMMAAGNPDLRCVPGR